MITEESNGEIFIADPAIKYIPKLKPKHKKPQADAKDKGLSIPSLAINAGGWDKHKSVENLETLDLGEWMLSHRPFSLL